MTRPARRRRSTCCWPRPGASPGRSPAREQGSAWPGGTVPLCRRLRPSRSTTPGPSARGPRGRPSGRAQRLHRTWKQASTSPKPPQSGQKNVPAQKPAILKIRDIGGLLASRRAFGGVAERLRERQRGIGGSKWRIRERLRAPLQPFRGPRGRALLRAPRRARCSPLAGAAIS